MTRIPINYGEKDEKCVCCKIETMPHIYNCECLNEKKSKIKYDEIYNGTLINQIEIFRRMEENLAKRQKIKLKNDIPCDLSDPLDCLKSRFG